MTGNVVPLLGLNAGANLDFVAADNIRLLLRIGGRRPTPAIVDEIWAFTELDERMRQMPLRMFSSRHADARPVRDGRRLFRPISCCSTNGSAWSMKNSSAKAESRLRKLVAQAGIVIIASHDQRAAAPHLHQHRHPRSRARRSDGCSRRKTGAHMEHGGEAGMEEDTGCQRISW